MNYEKQANDFAAKHNVKLKVLDVNYGKFFTDEKEQRWIFKLKLTRGRKAYTFKFGQSIAAGNEEPRMYDVLACMTKYDIGSFEDFCSEFGYDNDSRKAHKTYLAVCKEFKNIDRLFNDCMTELQEIA